MNAPLCQASTPRSVIGTSTVSLDIFIFRWYHFPLNSTLPFRFTILSPFQNTVPESLLPVLHRSMVLLLRLSIPLKRFFHTEPTAPSTRFGIKYILESHFRHTLYRENDICHRNIKFHFLGDFGRFIPLRVKKYTIKKSIHYFTLNLC